MLCFLIPLQTGLFVCRGFSIVLSALSCLSRFGESILGIVHADEELASGAFQRHDELGVVGIAMGGVFCHRAVNGVAGALSDGGDDVVGRREGGVDLSGDDFFNVWGVKGNVAGQAVIEGARQAVHIGKKGFGFSVDFFRGDVVGRAPDGVVVVGVFEGINGEAEVNQFRLAFLVEEDVARFDVAVKEVFL